MNPARDQPTFDDIVDATVARMPSNRVWLWWHHNVDYIRAALSRDDGSLDTHQHAWILLDHPELDHTPPAGRWDGDRRMYLCHGALEHAAQHGTWTAAHQQFTIEREPDFAAHHTVELRDWSDAVHAAELTIDIGDTPTRRADGTPVGIGWALHTVAPDATSDVDVDDIWHDTLAGIHIAASLATRLDRNINPTRMHDRARLHISTGSTFHIGRWLCAHPEQADTIWDLATSAPLHSAVLELDSALASYLLCNPRVDNSVAARIPVAVARNLHHTTAPTVRERWPGLASDTAGSLWDSWGGTIGELADTVARINQPASAPCDFEDAAARALRLHSSGNISQSEP